ncbi:NAD dependent epimerase/dehydratase family protein [Paramicrobacterium humi]|uniref:NAD dependent epimerase/dehydratase family protein n=1 Tax=Paramicrobacterium humi TaxID=640635 RepID=A0A1H4K2P5_9MICO|nr:NAD(P)-dependent oxidoreductase [Microbacterium humi]SEB52556.1 NAD dependent epimerase/dehydratase family protein [Microbacterium humi]
MDRIAITGAAGRIGATVLPLLRRPEREFVLIDSKRVSSAASDDVVIELDILDRDALREAFRGADTVIHLAGIPSETAWEDLLQTNIDGTQAVLEAAKDARVGSIMLASSIHAVGMSTMEDARRTGTLIPRPEGFYGVSKAAMEALGSMYADRYGMTVVSARICAFSDDPESGLGPQTWFAPADAARLIEAVHALDRPGHHIVWGVSATGADALEVAEGQGIGFHPAERAAVSASSALAPDTRLAGPAAEARNMPGEHWS